MRGLHIWPISLKATVPAFSVRTHSALHAPYAACATMPLCLAARPLGVVKTRVCRKPTFTDRDRGDLRLRGDSHSPYLLSLHVTHIEREIHCTRPSSGLCTCCRSLGSTPTLADHALVPCQRSMRRLWVSWLRVSAWGGPPMAPWGTVTAPSQVLAGSHFRYCETGTACPACTPLFPFERLGQVSFFFALSHLPLLLHLPPKLFPRHAPSWGLRVPVCVVLPGRAALTARGVRVPGVLGVLVLGVLGVLAH